MFSIKDVRLRLGIRVALVTLSISMVAAANLPAGAVDLRRVNPAVSSESSLLPLEDLPPAEAMTLTYCSPDGAPLKMDFYRPSGRRAVPVVLQVHGGGWAFGNRSSTVTADLVSAFLSRGLAFATIDYRLWNGPAASADVACAVRFLRASARKLKIDGAHIGAMGQSAGGQLVSLLGTAGAHATGEVVLQYLYQSSRVQAVAAQWGPVIFDTTAIDLIASIPIAFGTSDPRALKRYSPLSYLTPDDPPFLIVQGTEDAVVPRYQAETFADALQSAHIPAQLLLIERAGHYLQPAGGTPSATPEHVTSALATFFADRLRD